MSQGDVFTQYRALFSSSSIPPYQSPEVKKVNDLEFVDFLFELIKATKGQQQFKNIILKGAFSELKQKADINLKIKKILRDFFACEVNILIPDALTVHSVAGINLDLSEIDPQGLLQTDPNSDLGKHLYEGNNPSKHINYLFYQAQKTTKDKPLVFPYKDRDLFQIYSTSVSSMNFKFGDYYKNRPIADWITDYLDSTDFFNLPNFTSMLMDLITGAISLKAGKGKMEIKQDSGIIKALQKIFGFCSDNAANNNATDASLGTFLNSNQTDNSQGGDITSEPNPFDFTPSELQEINDDADLRSRGVIRFSTCGDLDLEMDPDGILAGLNSLFGAYQDVPQDNIDNLVPGDYDNANAFFNIDKVNNFFDDTLRTGAKKAIDQGETDLNLSFPNMQAELQLGIFKAIPYAFIKGVLGPKLLLLPKVSSEVIKLSPGNIQPVKVDVQNVVSQITPILQNIGLEIVDKLIANIFNEIKKDILKLTKDLALSYIQQRGADYIATLTSLLSLLKKLLKRDSSRCKSVLSQLTSLLSLGNFGPMPSIPGPLILIGGLLKPGLNKVAMVNDLKAKLQSKGIETAPFFPDGTPNYMMYAMEELMGVVTQHIKTNAKIDVFAMGPTGPVQGSAQIQ